MTEDTDAVSPSGRALVLAVALAVPIGLALMAESQGPAPGLEEGGHGDERGGYGEEEHEDD